jgi:hypothetical protein
MSEPDYTRFVFAEGGVLVAEVRERTTTGFRTAYHVRVHATGTSKTAAHVSMLKELIFHSHGLSEAASERLAAAIHRELAGQAA